MENKKERPSTNVCGADTSVYKENFQGAAVYE